MCAPPSANMDVQVPVAHQRFTVGWDAYIIMSCYVEAVCSEKC